MKNLKYKILVLSDLKRSAESTLKSAISLAQMIDGEIKLLHVKKAIELVDRESQLSAIRTINKEHVLTDKKIEEFVRPFQKDFGVTISHKLAIGNLKNEIDTFIATYNPDIIVVGKKKTNLLSVVGDNVINFILKKYKGTLLVAGNDSLHPNDEVSLGVLNAAEETIDTSFMEELFERTTQPIKTFKINKDGQGSLNTKSPSFGNKIVEYVFDDAHQAINSISRYASKSKINLMCVDKTDSSIKDLINKLNFSLLLTEKEPTTLHN